MEWVPQFGQLGDRRAPWIQSLELRENKTYILRQVAVARKRTRSMHSCANTAMRVLDNQVNSGIGTINETDSCSRTNASPSFNLGICSSLAHKIRPFKGTRAISRFFRQLKIHFFFNFVNERKKYLTHRNYPFFIAYPYLMNTNVT